MRRSASTLVRATSRHAVSLPKPYRAYATVADPLHKDPVELDQITKLPNGIRVATESLPGPFSAAGVYIDAGSRYENDSLRGCSHLVDRMAFKSTKTRSVDQVLESMETLGGNIQCASSREAMMYQAATFNSAVPSAVGLLAETIRDPRITDEEVSQQVDTAKYEIGEIWGKPELIIPEVVHLAAFKDNTLGNPLLCPAERLPDMSKGLLERYRDVFYKPSRMVVAFAGVKHDEAIRLTQQFFGDMPADREQDESRPDSSASSDTSTAPSPDFSSSASTASSNSISSNPPSPSSHTSSPSKLLSKIPFLANMSTSSASRASVSPLDPSLLQPSTLNLSAPSHYTGGFLALPPIPPPASPIQPPLTHVHIAFEAVPISSPYIYAVAILQTLLGGGGSFSAGGPGKGMYSRLYTNVLNQHGWIENCVSFNHSYTDSGLFGIAAACIPSQAGALIDVMCRELQALTLSENHLTSLQANEVNRAKNQLRSSLLMNLESRLVELEDLGRQVQVHGKKVGVKEMCEKIEAVTMRELRDVARMILKGTVRNAGRGSGAPTVVVQEGEVNGEKNKPLLWEDIQNRIQKWRLGQL
ncbi:MAG: hypothetical protein Q9227_004505 [Pyrenula ochraceoflavens]